MYRASRREIKAKHLSFLSQSISARDENLSKTMFLPLAERMVEKMVKEDKIEAEAEVSYRPLPLPSWDRLQPALPASVPASAS